MYDFIGDIHGHADKLEELLCYTNRHDRMNDCIKSV